MFQHLICKYLIQLITLDTEELLTAAQNKSFFCDMAQLIKTTVYMAQLITTITNGVFKVFKGHK